MEFCLVYEDSEGKCRVITPFEKFQQIRETDESAIYRCAEMSIPGEVEFIKCSPDKIPKDKSFRQAWVRGDINQPVKIDLEKAIGIQRNYLVDACEKKIAQLNLDLEKAIEDDHLPRQVAIRATKKILRNLHEMNLSHCKTVDDIKESVPRELRDVWSYYNPK